MTSPGRRLSALRRNQGFSLVVSLMMMALLAVITLAMLGLSATELRRSTMGIHQAQARANARLALAQAIGQLQRNLGPDQRVSATGELVGGAADGAIEPHWTGVWRTTREDGSSYWMRDSETGGWIDLRHAADSTGPEVLEWLVSGGGELPAGSDSISLVGDGSVGDHADARVHAPLIPVGGGDDESRIAWWTGDLGVRANLAVADAHGEAPVDPGQPGRDEFRLLASQQADAGVMTGGESIDSRRRDALGSAGMVGVATGSRGWEKERFHDFTVSSRGVQADVHAGGLKRDLSAYLQSPDGVIRPKDGLEGLDDGAGILDVLATASRHQLSGPCFGVIRDWARELAAYDGSGVVSRAPAGVDDAAELAAMSRDRAYANETPTELRSRSSKLQPILVEASHYLQISNFPTQQGKFQLRHHLYPRVVLWNPYNVELEFDPAIVMIQGNGRQEMWTLDTEERIGKWISFEGGRRTDFIDNILLLTTSAYDDPYMGCYYFSVPKTTFGPGECLVFSPANSAEYDALSTYKSGAYNLANNRLSCEVGPDPARSFYVSGSDIGGGQTYPMVSFWYKPTPLWLSEFANGVEYQADDTRVVMKSIGNASTVTYESFDALPQLAYVSASLQYGAGKEPRIEWYARMDMELLSAQSPTPTLAPSVRTREGIRLRWFDEHESNRKGAGPLEGTGFFDEAPFANWNPRAAYALRTPWENIGGTLDSGSAGAGGQGGSTKWGVDIGSDSGYGHAGGPWFFGIYTRDLYDQAVGWSDQMPVYRDGRYHGNPFGPPQEGRARNILFELPREGVGVVSLGQFQHAQFSEFVWHPSFAFGNSLADPRLGLDGLAGTVPPTGSVAAEALGGFHHGAIGWAADGERSHGRDDWASTARGLLQDVPESDHVVYDLSFELNQALWDRYYVSSGDYRDKEDFLVSPARNPLPSGRMRLAASTRAEATTSRLADFHRSAYHLVVDGAFNVNSTRVEAWKAVLAAARGHGGGGGTPVARILDPPDGTWDGGNPEGQDAWSGRRVLDDGEIARLAEAIVDEVRARGPFLSLADFVNRRLAGDETGRSGALQAAIDRSGINAGFDSGSYGDLRIDNDESIRDYNHPDHIDDATRLEHRLKPSSKAWGAPGFVTQGDLLQGLAPVLSARSDTFLIRAYGDSRDAAGSVVSRAWCEATVQRTPVPLEPDASGLNSARQGDDDDFGRRFEVVSFRWLRPEEV